MPWPIIAIAPHPFHLAKFPATVQQALLRQTRCCQASNLRSCGWRVVRIAGHFWGSNFMAMFFPHFFHRHEKKHVAVFFCAHLSFPPQKKTFWYVTFRKEYTKLPFISLSHSCPNAKFVPSYITWCGTGSSGRGTGRGTRHHDTSRCVWHLMHFVFQGA